MTAAFRWVSLGDGWPDWMDQVGAKLIGAFHLATEEAGLSEADARKQLHIFIDGLRRID